MSLTAGDLKSTGMLKTLKRMSTHGNREFHNNLARMLELKDLKEIEKQVEVEEEEEDNNHLIGTSLFIFKRTNKFRRFI
jgi:hypothetical protein